MQRTISESSGYGRKNIGSKKKGEEQFKKKILDKGRGNDRVGRGRQWQPRGNI